MAAMSPTGTRGSLRGSEGVSEKPFAEAFSALKSERHLSFRELSEATRKADPTGKGISYAHLARFARGEYVPTTETIAVIARTLEVTPEYFAEVRLHAVRRLFDPRQRGFGPAMAQLKRYEQSVNGDG